MSWMLTIAFLIDQRDIKAVLRDLNTLRRAADTQACLVVDEFVVLYAKAMKSAVALTEQVTSIIRHRDPIKTFQR